MRPIRSLKSAERKLKCWQRDAMVAGIGHRVNAAIRRRVDLDDVRRAARCDLEAARAHPARLVGGTLAAVEAARQNAGRSGLPRAPLAGKDVAVGDAVLSDGVTQC